MRYLSLLIPLFPVLCYPQTPVWDDASSVVADINCDGVQDMAKIGYLDSEVVLSVTLGDSNQEHSLTFGIGSSMRQDALCGTSVQLSRETPPRNNEDTFVNGLGTVPEGHIDQEGCFDLKLSGGECDAIHIYWNHSTHRLSWWRL